MEALSGVSRIIRCNIIQFNHLQFRAKIVLQDRPLRTGGRKSSILHMGRLNVLIQWNKNSRGGFLRVNWKRPAVRRCTVEKQGQKRQNEKYFSSSLNCVCCRLGQSSSFDFCFFVRVPKTNWKPNLYVRLSKRINTFDSDKYFESIITNDV